jgi:gluconolactonase
MTNGGTGPLDGNLVLVTSGLGPLPPSVALIDPNSNNVTVLLDNFFGRQFNSLNDIKIHPTSGALFFTDPSYVRLPLPQPILIIAIADMDSETIFVLLLSFQIKFID